MVENAKEKALAWLDEKGIPYERVDHEAVFTMEEMEAAGLTQKGGVCKNLFVRDARGKNHYLIVVPEEKKVDLNTMAGELASTRLSFASADRLEKYLGVAQGSVSPLGVLNDPDHKVVVAFDRGIKDNDEIGIHPNDNTSTIWIRFRELKKAIKSLGNPVVTVRV